MRRRLPPLLALRAFEAFARARTVRMAAEELAISHTVVSRHIQNLELSLDVKLVRKSGRGIVLTREGKRYAGQLRIALDLIAEATSEVRSGNSDALHICCMAGLASRRVLARLPEIERVLGGREITLEPIAGRPDFFQNEIDAEINYLENPVFDEELRGEMFCRPRILAVTSPAFKAAYPDATIADLLQMPLLHGRSTHQWESWFRQAGVTDLPRLRGPRLWHGHMAVDGAILGMGVALVSDLMATELLARGDLVEIVPTEVYLDGYYFVALARRWDDPPIAALRNWLYETFCR